MDEALSRRRAVGSRYIQHMHANWRVWRVAGRVGRGPRPLTCPLVSSSNVAPALVIAHIAGTGHTCAESGTG